MVYQNIGNKIMKKKNKKNMAVDRINKRYDCFVLFFCIKIERKKRREVDLLFFCNYFNRKRSLLSGTIRTAVLRIGHESR
jgi:hypothetical protein